MPISIDTTTINTTTTTDLKDTYKILYEHIRNLEKNIKDTACDIENEKLYNSDLYKNSSNIFCNSFDILFNIANNNNIDAAYTAYHTGSMIGIDSTGLSTDFTMTNDIFKGTLKNCLSLKITQSQFSNNNTAATTDDKVVNTMLDDELTTKKMHLLYYGKFASTADFEIKVDPVRVQHIYYTILLLDVYIEIVEAFLTIDLSSNIEEKRAFWNLTEDVGSNNISNHLGTNDITYNNLYPKAGSANTKKIKSYINYINIVLKPLYKGSTTKCMFITDSSGSAVTTADVKPRNGIYLYNNLLETLFLNGYFDKEGAAGAAGAVGEEGAAMYTTIPTNYTFTNNNGEINLSDTNFGYFKNGTKYRNGYFRISFDPVSGTDYADAKKPYLKLIKIFLSMIRNIKYDNLLLTLQYLKMYLYSLKSLLLTSIKVINIYHNLNWSLKSLFALNYPDYSHTLFKTFIHTQGTGASDIASRLEAIKLAYTATISGSDTLAHAGYAFDTTSATANNFAFYVTPKNITSSSGESYGKLLDYNIYKLDKEINKTNQSNIISRYINPLDYQSISNTFTYDKENLTIKVTTAASSILNLLLSDYKSNIKKNYYIYIPFYERKLEISDYKITEYTTITFNLNEDASLNNGDNPHSLYLLPIGIEEYKKYNNNLSDNIKDLEENINYNKTQILNNKSIFDTNKSKNIILYYELLIFALIILFILFILIIINIAKIEIGLMKMISLICFGTLIVLLSLYFIIDTLYINESYIETFSTTTEDAAAAAASTNIYTSNICNTNCVNPLVATPAASNVRENDNTIKTNKKTIVTNMLKNNAKELINKIRLSYTYTDTLSLLNKELQLNSLIKHKYNDKDYINSFIKNKTEDAHINTDMIKYENLNYNVNILSIILLSIIIVSAYIINLFTNNNYLGLLFLTAIILIITLFTYYMININKIVRTISSNYYWGKEFKKTYELFENPEISKSGTEVVCDLPILKNNKLYFTCGGNTQLLEKSIESMGTQNSNGNGVVSMGTQNLNGNGVVSMGTQNSNGNGVVSMGTQNSNSEGVMRLGAQNSNN